MFKSFELVSIYRGDDGFAESESVPLGLRPPLLSKREGENGRTELHEVLFQSGQPVLEGLRPEVLGQGVSGGVQAEEPDKKVKCILRGKGNKKRK